jgi:hypothetical protein
MSKKTTKKISKVETVEEYLARGGKIEFIPEVPREPQVEVVKTTNVGPAVFMTLQEADLFYGETRKGAKQGNKKSKPSPKIDLGALPPALRSKYIAKLKEEVDGEGFEEELEKISQEAAKKEKSNTKGEKGRA